MEHTWPPPPRTASPPKAAKSKILDRGYSVGFIGIPVVALATLGFMAVSSSAINKLILLVFGLSLCLRGFQLSVLDIRIGAAESNSDSIIVGGLGLFLNVVTLVITCFCALVVYKR